MTYGTHDCVAIAATMIGVVLWSRGGIDAEVGLWLSFFGFGTWLEISLGEVSDAAWY